jgi:hypothetical protein
MSAVDTEYVVSAKSGKKAHELPCKMNTAPLFLFPAQVNKRADSALYRGDRMRGTYAEDRLVDSG